MKTSTFRVIACVLALTLCLFTVACATASDPTPPAMSNGDPAPAESAYLAIDINPSVELLIENDKVVEFRALNDDAEILLSGESLTGLTVEEATERIVALAEEMGYLNDENTDVNLTVAADDSTLTAKIEAAAQSGAERGSAKAIVNRDPRSGDIRTVKALQDKDPELYKHLTPAKVRLIEAIMEIDDTMTFEQGATMTVKALSKRLDALTDDLKEVAGKELKEKFKERVSALRDEVNAGIATIYGEEYLAKWEQYTALKALEKSIEHAAEHRALSGEDLQELNDLIQGLDPNAALPEGELSAEALEDWIDRIDDRLPEYLEEHFEDAAETVFERYDEDSYQLTEADIAAITEILGTAPDFTTLEGLEDYLDAAEDELESLRESINLTEEQKAAIEALKSELNTVQTQARNEFKDDIAKAKEDFANLKKGKLPH